MAKVRGISSLERMALIATTIQPLVPIAQLIVVVISACLIWYQLVQQTMLTRATNAQTLVSLSSPLNSILITDAKVTKLWLKHSRRFSNAAEPRESDVGEERITTLLASFLILYENIFSQYRNGLLDQDIWEGWDKDLEVFVENQCIGLYWENWRDLYHREFREHVDEIINKQTPCPKPT